MDAVGAVFRRIHNDQLVYDFQRLCGVRKIEQDNADKSNSLNVKYVIENRLLYYFFTAASFIGTEEFYAIFFPFFFWNLDPQTGRKVCMVWALSMYVGQALKDILRIPRPQSPPAVHLETSFILEYGMPSTHAVVATGVPLSLWLFARSTCQFATSTILCLTLLIPLCVLISRVYLGVHRFSDITVGSLIGATEALILVPIVNAMDSVLMSNWNGVLAILLVFLTASCFYPTTDGKMSYSWYDTTVIMGTGAAAQVAGRLGHDTGLFPSPLETHKCYMPGLAHLAPEVPMMLLRCGIGMVTLGVMRIVFKKLFIAAFCYAYGVASDDQLRQHAKAMVYKGFTLYFTLSLIAMFFIPAMLYALGIAEDFDMF